MVHHIKKFRNTKKICLQSLNDRRSIELIQKNTVEKRIHCTLLFFFLKITVGFAALPLYKARWCTPCSTLELTHLFLSIAFSSSSKYVTNFYVSARAVAPMGRHPPVDEAMDFNGNGRDEANPSGSEAGNHNEHRGDDPSRVGQSLPADIRQNGQPTLGEEITAPLWEEFEALGIHVRRSEPVFPPRPGYGAAGTPYVVRANLFLGRLVDEALHQYNVSARTLSSSTSRCWF